MFSELRFEVSPVFFCFEDIRCCICATCLAPRGRDGHGEGELPPDRRLCWKLRLTAFGFGAVDEIVLSLYLS